MAVNYEIKMCYQSFVVSMFLFILLVFVERVEWRIYAQEIRVINLPTMKSNSCLCLCYVRIAYQPHFQFDFWEFAVLELHCDSVLLDFVDE